MYIAITRPQHEDNFFSPASTMRYFQPTYSLEDFLVPHVRLARFGNCRPNKSHMKNIQDETTVNKDNSKFEVKINIQDYKPEELDVKTVDGFVVITGKHEEKKDEHGFVSRQFSRRYTLPEGVKPESITCSLSSDGVLWVSAPLAIENAPENERKIPISFTPMEDSPFTATVINSQTSAVNTEDAKKDN